MTLDDHVAEHVAEHNRIRVSRRRRPLTDVQIAGIRAEIARALGEKQRKSELSAFAAERGALLNYKPINPEGEEVLMPEDGR
jgi:hypothetical protein